MRKYTEHVTYITMQRLVSGSEKIITCS